MKNLIDQTLEKIKSEDIKPTARWRFLLKNYLVWFTAALTLVLGSLAVPVVIHMLTTNDWEIYAYTNVSPAQLVLLSLPYFWLLFLALFVGAAYYNIRRTKTGYRYGIAYIIAGSVAVSLIFGGALYGAGAGRVIDEEFARRLPLYERFARPRHIIWAQNSHGLLAGKIITITDDTHFQLKDLRDRQWEVIYVPNLTESSPDAALRRQILLLEPGLRVRAVGRPVDEDTFNAHMLAPFEGRGVWLPAAGITLPPHFQMMR